MALREQVTALMRGVAAEVVMPRFGKVGAEHIAEKRPGEIVTHIDREAEYCLDRGLAALGLGARIVGEEAADANPQLLHGLGEGLVWLIDPLDGTANYAAGHGPFGMMVALVDDGEAIAGWLLDPVSGRLCHAERGRGATCNGVPVQARATGAIPPIASLATQFMHAERRARIEAEAARAFELMPIPRCAAEHYPRLALAKNDVALFQRILPWDHAAGALFLTEAGGRVSHWDRTPYRVGGPGKGLIAAASPDLWEAAVELLDMGLCTA
jgi:fructose-1,6-bisphosphatase/inositol monophosphatase family enzyme